MRHTERTRHRAMMARVRHAMVVAGLNQAELARRLHVAPATVSEWWSRDAQPTSATVALMPQVLGVSGHWLLTGRGGEAPPDAEGAPLLARGALISLAMLEDYVAQERARWATRRATGVQDVEDAVADVRQAQAGRPSPAARARGHRRA